MAAATCLSPRTRPARVQYAEGQCPGCMAGIVAEDRAQSADLKTLGMQCFPLYSLLLAAAGQGVTVNYLRFVSKRPVPCKCHAMLILRNSTKDFMLLDM